MPDPIQFDKAEYAGTATPASCTQCQQGLGGQYYELNGLVICSGCRDGIEAARSAGSRLGRASRAILFGGVAAALGTAIWYGVRAISGYEFGLLAILVGLAVGGAVRAGSRGRGGWAYQALAMFLTYASIVSTYVPEILKAIRESPEAAADAANAPQTPAAARPTPAQSTPTSTPALTPATTQPAAAAQPPEPARPMTFAQGLAAVALAGLFLMALAFAAPFLAGLENIMGLIIIAIGLYEAWKINRAVPLVITGPYRLASTAAPARA